jgi:hypothetical protein
MAHTFLAPLPLRKSRRYEFMNDLAPQVRAVD